MLHPEGDGRQRRGGLGQICATDSGRLEAELEGMTLETSKEAAAGAEGGVGGLVWGSDGEHSRDG